MQHNLSAEAILTHLNPDCSLNRLQIFDVIDSTNTAAKRMAAEGAVHGTVVIAEHQTAGRGRLGRSFHSPDAKGIYLSVVLRLGCDIATAALTTPAAAVGVARAINRVTGLEPQIKWVNDVYLGGRKVCGILTEASMEVSGGVPAFLILGIGINVEQAVFPEELRPIVTAISEHTDAPLDRNELIAALLNELDILLSSLSSREFMEEYRFRSLLIGKEINVLRPDQTIPATAESINDDGHLIVRLEDGTLLTLSSGEVSVRLK